MQPFNRYFKDKLKDPGFRSLYEAECNVCANTVGIFEKVDIENISLASLARDVDAGTEELEALQDADRCNPHLVIRLCRHLGLPVPKNCFKLD